MLTLQQIRENTERVIARLAVKGFNGKEPIENIIALDNQRKSLQLQSDTLSADLNKLAASIGALMKSGQKAEAEEAKAKVSEIKEKQKAFAEELAKTEQEIREILLSVPNVPYEGVPEGKSAADNVVEKTGGTMPELGDDALPHWDLAKKYNTTVEGIMEVNDLESGDIKAGDRLLIFKENMSIL